MLVLALDTALSATQVAVLDAAGTVDVRLSRPMATGHAEALLPAVEEALAAAGRRHADIDRIAVTVGPGTFTGIRIALAAARAFALVLGRPAVGVSTLAALAWGAGQAVLAAIDARRGELYVQRFDAGGRPLGEARAAAVGAAAADLPRGAAVIGTGAPLLAAVRPDLRVLAAPDAPDIAAVARLAAREAVPVGLPVPLYLRAPDAKPQAPPLARQA